MPVFLIIPFWHESICTNPFSLEIELRLIRKKEDTKFATAKYNNRVILCVFNQCETGFWKKTITQKGCTTNKQKNNTTHQETGCDFCW